MGFVVDKVASGQVFSEYFRFPCHKPFIPPTSPSSSQLKKIYKRKKGCLPLGKGLVSRHLKGAKDSKVSKLAQRNVDF
jgi:hypothetical protein